MAMEVPRIFLRSSLDKKPGDIFHFAEVGIVKLLGLILCAPRTLTGRPLLLLLLLLFLLLLFFFGGEGEACLTPQYVGINSGLFWEWGCGKQCAAAGDWNSKDLIDLLIFLSIPPFKRFFLGNFPARGFLWFLLDGLVPLFLWKISVNWQLLLDNSGFCWWGCKSTWLSYMEKWQSMWYTPNTVSFVQRTMINYRIYSILEYWYAMFRRAKKKRTDNIVGYMDKDSLFISKTSRCFTSVFATNHP